MKIMKQENKLHLSKVLLTAEYRKKWNVDQNDFVLLTRDNEPVNSSLYRTGGIFNVNLKNDYFILLKQVEDYYDDTITKDKNKKPHLAQCSCIIDKNGVEKKVFNHFENPYLVKNSLIYSINGNYYNIETGEFYCRANTSMDSTDFLFIENKWDDDETKRGILKIHKKTGTVELFK